MTPSPAKRCRAGRDTVAGRPGPVRGRDVPQTIVDHRSAGQRGDSPQITTAVEAISVHAHGRPRNRPDRVLADKACSSAANRTYLRTRGICATIPTKADQGRPEGGGLVWLAATSVRRRALQAEPCSRVPHQPTGVEPDRARGSLHRHNPHRRHQPVVPHRRLLKHP